MYEILLVYKNINHQLHLADLLFLEGMQLGSIKASNTDSASSTASCYNAGRPTPREPNCVTSNLFSVPQCVYQANEEAT